MTNKNVSLAESWPLPPSSFYPGSFLCSGIHRANLLLFTCDVIWKQLSNPPLNLFSPRLTSPGSFNTPWLDMILSPFVTLVTLLWMGSSLSLKIGTQNWSHKCSRCGLPAELRAGLSKPQIPHTHAHVLCGQGTVSIATACNFFLESQNAQFM